MFLISLEDYPVTGFAFFPRVLLCVYLDVGPLDMVVNNAGIADLTPFIDTDPEIFTNVSPTSTSSSTLIDMSGYECECAGSHGRCSNCSPLHD